MTATIEAQAAAADTLISSFVLTGDGPPLDVVPAITGTPSLTRTIDGGSSFDLALADYRYALVNHPKFASRFYGDMGGLGYEGVSVKCDPNLLTVTFEDAITAACKRPVAARKVDKGTMTRQQIARMFLADVGPIELLVENDGRGVVNADVERAADQNPWDALGALASDVAWRRFSDGRRVVMGSDAWLATLSAPAVFTPHTGPVHDVTFDLDVGQPVATITFEVDALSWTLPPGRAFTMTDLGLASGTWLLTDFERGLFSLRAKVTGQRRQAVLPEPPPEQTDVAGEVGEIGNLPVTTPAATSAPTTTSSPSSQGMNKIADLAVALASKGLPYVFGAKGPNAYDCSGFVAAVTKQYGKQLSGGSKAQFATCKAQGRLISVQEGLRTRGAIFFRMTGNPTHVAISLGNGTTAEARGRKYGVKVFGGAPGRFTHAARWE